MWFLDRLNRIAERFDVKYFLNVVIGAEIYVEPILLHVHLGDFQKK